MTTALPPLPDLEIPVGEPLQPWFNRQRESTDPDLIYKSASGHQIMFVRDQLARVVLWGMTLGERADLVTVISTHRSKSVVLPVYSIERRDVGLRMFLRDNFYNWKLSVVSERPIVADFDGLFYTTPPVDPNYTGNPLSSVYFEGFPEQLCFGYYEPSDKRRWSAELYSDYATWAALFLIMRSLGVVKAMQWSQRDSKER